MLDLGERLEDLTIMLRRLIGEKVKLEVKHDRDLWPVKADISQFEQVIVNLAVNARDAMPNGGKLNVRTANVDAAEAARMNYKGMPAADYVLVEVADTGTGIPPEIIDKIFDPFFSTKEVGKGTGLGLSTVYGIVKQTGGFIYPDSAPGKGTTFRIFLPRHVPDAAEEMSDILRAADRRRGAGRRKIRRRRRTLPQPAADLTGQGTILLVEDEEGLRALNARGLTSRGYSVLEAGNGVEAIEVLRQARRPGRSRRVRRGDAGDGRPDAAQGVAQAQSGAEDHLRLGLRRGGVRQEPAARGRSSSRSCPSRSPSSNWSAR